MFARLRRPRRPPIHPVGRWAVRFVFAAVFTVLVLLVEPPHAWAVADIPNHRAEGHRRRGRWGRGVNRAGRLVRALPLLLALAVLALVPLSAQSARSVSMHTERAAAQAPADPEPPRPEPQPAPGPATPDPEPGPAQPGPARADPRTRPPVPRPF